MTTTSPRPGLALSGITAALSVFGAAQGLSYPLFTLLMQRHGMPPAAIGLSAAMMPIGFVLCSFVLPRLIRTIGAPRIAVGAALLGALCFLAIGLLQNWVAWYPLRFLMGVVINPLFVLGEFWALALAPPDRRGRTMGVFNTLFGLGYAVGPLVLMTVGIQGWPPFAVAIFGFLICALVLNAVSSALIGFEKHEEGRPVGVVGFAGRAPALLLSVLVSASIQQSSFSLLPVFGAGYGLPPASLAALVTAASTGNVCLQIPLGLLAERFGARRMAIACAIVAAGCGALLPLLVLTPASWPLLAVMGGCGYGIYTMGVVELGERFKGAVLVAGNSAFALTWGVGGIIGPPTSGVLMQLAGARAFPLMLGLTCSMLAMFMIYRAAKQA